MILLEATGGLANRMRTIATAVSACQPFNTKLHVIWNENAELNCPFGRLFEPANGFTIVEKKLVHRHITRPNEHHLKSAIKARIVNYLLGFNYCLSDLDHPFDLTKNLRANKNIYIKTCQRFSESHEWYKLFKPIPAIARKIESVSKLFDENTVGVQIRRTDHGYAISHSPTTLFISEMKALLQKRPNVSFFLTTDDIEVEKELKQLFPGKIISHPKELSRITETGIQDAVADLFTLSKTSLILGSYWSSFAEVAAWMGNKPLQIVKNQP